MARFIRAVSSRRRGSRRAIQKIGFGIVLLLLLVTVTTTTIKRPSAASTVTSQALGALPRTTNGIHPGITFDYLLVGAANNASELATLKNDVQYVWAATSGTPSSIGQGSYLPFQRDWNTGYNTPGHDDDLSWWRANHPDWIAYQCDRITPAYEFGNPFIPLDISNPDVRNYQYNVLAKPLLQHGYNIAWDNVTLGNLEGRCGHYDRNGQWVARYSGQQTDAAYQNDVLTWAKDMYSRIHADFPYRMMTINYSENDSRLFAYTDMILIEGGFTNFGNPTAGLLHDQNWLDKVQAIQTATTLGKAVLIGNEFPVNRRPSDADYLSYNLAAIRDIDRDITWSEVQWATANYLLVKGDYTFMNISPVCYGCSNTHSDFKSEAYQGYGYFYDRPEYHIAIGQPTGGVAESQGVYSRAYSNGVAIVNPSSSVTRTVQLATEYKTLDGVNVRSVTLPPTTGQVLLAVATSTPVPTPTTKSTSTPTPTPAPNPAVGQTSPTPTPAASTRAPSPAPSVASTSTPQPSHNIITNAVSLITDWLSPSKPQPNTTSMSRTTPVSTPYIPLSVLNQVGVKYSTVVFGTHQARADGTKIPICIAIRDQQAKIMVNAEPVIISDRATDIISPPVLRTDKSCWQSAVASASAGESNITISVGGKQLNRSAVTFSAVPLATGNVSPVATPALSLKILQLSPWFGVVLMLLLAVWLIASGANELVHYGRLEREV